MGLDMYVYRLQKLTDAQVKEMTGMMEDEALDKYNILEIPREEKDSSEILPILPILRSVRMKQKAYDFQKMKKDYGIHESWELVPFEFDPEKTSFAVDHLEKYVIPFEEIKKDLPEDEYHVLMEIFRIWQRKPENSGKKVIRPEAVKKTDSGYEITVVESGTRISISTKDIEKKYTVVKERDLLCCRFKKGAYWRKEYSLLNRIHKASPYTIENCGYYPLTDEMEKVINDDLTSNGYPPLEAGDGEVLVYHEWY